MQSWSFAATTDPAWPAGVRRLDYRSASDGAPDWALVWPPASGATWVVGIHGHGSHGDQLYTRQDIREQRLPLLRRHGWGILTPNLRDNAWMCASAAADLQALLALVRREFGAQRFVFFGGSMGGASNLIYAALHPEDAAGVVALGAAPDLAEYHAWCLRQTGTVCRQIAKAIAAAYGGAPNTFPDPYARHSAVRNASRLTMPVFLAHGARDAIMPVAGARRLVGVMAEAPDFTYIEVPDGNHDSPVFNLPEVFDWLDRRVGAGP